MKTLIFISLLLISQVIFAQTNDLVSQNLKLFNSDKEYHYNAVYIDKNGDTISNQNIIIDPTGLPHPLLERQTTLLIKFDYSSADSVRFASQPIIIGEKSDKINLSIWSKETKVMATENNFYIQMMHPFSTNQYLLTELAPNPHYDYTSNETNMVVTSSSSTLNHFKGSFKNYYDAKEEELKSYKFGNITCRKIESHSESKRYGVNKNTFYFNEKYGFTEFIYEFSNGQQMHFTLEKVVSNN